MFYRVLQVILLSLNAFLFYCAVVGVNRPHYEIMFLLSLGLTGSYVWYVVGRWCRGRPPCLPSGRGACWTVAAHPSPCEHQPRVPMYPTADPSCVSVCACLLACTPLRASAYLLFRFMIELAKTPLADAPPTAAAAAAAPALEVACPAAAPTGAKVAGKTE